MTPDPPIPVRHTCDVVRDAKGRLLGVDHWVLDARDVPLACYETEDEALAAIWRGRVLPGRSYLVPAWSVDTCGGEHLYPRS